MRVEIGYRIYSCTRVTHTPNSEILLFTTPNGVYTVKCHSVMDANIVYGKMLNYGYCSINEYDYEN